MVTPEEGRSFFQQLLHGLLHNLQPLQGPGGTQLHSSPLREASKDTLAAICQLLGPTAFLQQLLQSVTGLGSQSASLDPKQLEVLDDHVSVSLCKAVSMSLCWLYCVKCVAVAACVYVAGTYRIAVCSDACEVDVSFAKHVQLEVPRHHSARELIVYAQLVLTAFLAVLLHIMDLLYIVFPDLLLSSATQINMNIVD